ncbi:MAG: molybdopterin-dependent oxidoreductase alpha subunit [Candidatus Thalassarchaeaceae archaeon]
MVCWAMGITQHKNSVDTIQEIVNFQLLGGHVGRDGAGICPVRGHSNVQGDRTVGINHKPSKSFLESLSKNLGINPPKNHGVDTVGAVKLMNSKNNKIFLSMGGNFVSAMSDTLVTSKALSNCKLSVMISTKINRSHLITGNTALILPCLGRTEKDVTSSGNQFVSVENSMGVVHSSEGHSKPASKLLKSEVDIVCKIAIELEKLISKPPINWLELTENYDNIRNLIELCLPDFNNYNKRVREKGGFYLPNPPRDSRIFNTKSGKAEFKSNVISSIKSYEDKFTMMTIRSHDQYNTTIYGLNDRYRGITNGRRIIFMNSKDMKKLNLEKNDLVNITSHYFNRKITANKWFVVPYDIPEGNVATYFPESNVLIPLDSVADRSNTPTSKSITVSLDAI